MDENFGVTSPNTYNKYQELTAQLIEKKQEPSEVVQSEKKVSKSKVKKQK